MALVALAGSKRIFIGPNVWQSTSFPTSGTLTVDAANEAVIMVGYIETSDGGTHTIDTTGSSSMFWQSQAVVFANAGTTTKVGLAAVDTAAGPAARAVNVANVITFDVAKTMVGGGGGITSTAAQNHVPDSGSKTMANGDLVAFCIQMTARAGSDSVTVAVSSTSVNDLFPSATLLNSVGTYTSQNGIPNMFLTFSDGATGWFFASDVYSTHNGRSWNSSSGIKEYGQLYSVSFPLSLYGLYGWFQAATNSTNCDLVLYSDPLGTPVAERTISIDANTTSSTGQRRFTALFPSPYATTANQMIAAVFKPTTANNVQAPYKTLAAAGQRVSDPWSTSGYAISRASGAFADVNSSLDHYYIGLIAGAFNEESSAAILGGSVIS